MSTTPPPFDDAKYAKVEPRPEGWVVGLDPDTVGELSEPAVAQAFERPAAVDVPTDPSVPNHDPVHHPRHYNDHPSGVECIQVTEHMNFNVGNAVKYLWRAGKKDAMIQDLEKAKWYIDREIQRLKQEKTR